MANRFAYRGGEHETWLASVREPVIEPERLIVDAHHHLWVRDDSPYLLREFAHDLNSGHRVEASVFVECRSMYRAQGPDAMRPVGEMEFIRGIGAMSDAGAFSGEGVCRAAVGQANLQLGDAVAPVLEALVTASGERMRGVRASVCWDPSDSLHRAVPGDGYLAEPAVRKGIGVLDRLGLSLDCWLYHPQIPQLTAVADAFPNLTIVLNHAGTPILGGPYKDRQDTVRNTWLESMAELARRERVFVKLGALPARFERDDVSLPPDSHAVARAWQPWIQPCIELFGAARCMFESNFPVHKNWLSYAVLWNAFKRIAGGASEDEKRDLFAGAARRAYRM